MVNNTAIYVNTVNVLNTTVSQTCLQQRETAMKTPGAYVPFCEPNGTFTPLQCNPNTGYCFCVDPTGHVVPQTLAHVTQGTPACWTFNRNVTKKTTATTNESTTQPLCLTQQQLYTPVPGAFYPRCMPDGSFSPVQCQDSIGYCYCVTPDGTPIPGTTSLTGTPDCSQYMTTPIREDRPVPIPARSCQTAQQLYDTTTQLQAGAVRPWCEPDSSYSKVQCHVGLGYCFCVDPTTGEEIPGSETRGRPDCSKYDQTPVEEVVTEPPRNYECYDGDGKGYELAQSSYRDCNKCWCIEGGSWRCTKKRCQRGVCYHNGRKAKAGSTIKKDCNTCTCVDGDWDCTSRTCVSGSDRSSSNTQTVSSDREVTAMCQNGEPLVSCAVDPCQEKPRCATNPFAVCIPSHCGSCTRVFYAFGEKVTCEDF
ncbi:uncharacterized protein [Ptychodera flava]|uniref:uncharacterized protein n=1 Tax=Ptychodera flava TaxID=63121 RepID=UPI00396AA66C